MENIYLDLGYQNGWDHVPDEVLKCRELKHERNIKEIGKCLTEYSCEICGYVYKVDSSD